MKVGKIKWIGPRVPSPAASYEGLDRVTLERLAAYHRGELRRIEAEIIKHPPTMWPVKR